MNVEGNRTSLIGMLDNREDDDSLPVIGRIEVPAIQRDYAQGRLDASTEEIRRAFVESLVDAAQGPHDLGLDFVYGRLVGDVLVPLDGQQRLTTMFLLHWYLWSLAKPKEPQTQWRQFSYATRASARLFCERLGQHAWPGGAEPPSTWIVDQRWYQYLWRHDPTVQSALVMLDAIHDEICARPDFSPAEAWRRITDHDRPAVWFLLLALEDMTSDDELYIKMNSRGKPLTPFENFKARFEGDIRHSKRSSEFAEKIDGRWSDLMWPIHGGDYIVDDELYRYLDFVTELCEMREGRIPGGRLGPRAQVIFGPDNQRAQEHLDFLFDAFDVWGSYKDVEGFFTTHFSIDPPGTDDYDVSKVLLHGSSTTNLFEACSHQFEATPSGPRRFGVQYSLYLYAVLLHLKHETDDFPLRLRILRNLIADSEDEIRRDVMPRLIGDVEQVILHGAVDRVSVLSLNQRIDEQAKSEFLDQHPELLASAHRLEDHSFLRGNLTAFELDAANWEGRAEAFERAFANPEDWGELTAGLLATGDYQRRRPNSPSWQFGTSSRDNEAVWRTLFTDASVEAMAQTRSVLATFLDGFHAFKGSVREYVDAVIRPWLADRELRRYLDWRYYLVKYPAARSGSRGTFFAVDGVLGYSMCMLRTKTFGGKYRDSLLFAIWRESGMDDAIEDPWFTGYETKPRWMRMARSGVGVRVVDEGFELDWPEDGAVGPRALGALAEFPSWTASEDGGGVLRAEQRDGDGERIDTEDRVLLGVGLVRSLADVGL